MLLYGHNQSLPKVKQNFNKIEAKLDNLSLLVRIQKRWIIESHL